MGVLDCRATVYGYGTAVAPLPDTWLGDDDFLTAQTDFVMLRPWSPPVTLWELVSACDTLGAGHISDSSDEAQIKVPARILKGKPKKELQWRL
ncbi:hypothetical protein AK812_SmicGene4961 [Symbiodinium microadriaticum]|uniref:Uncharacterized protein n=1 Tax=Symbiodinium microadriaticum TaxID=2951 RepID=A0A1Q9EV02_SYMMI|nr:hypothetical protein AK812_SmicGene4961 [Symbiodinium microadriaticum]